MAPSPTSKRRVLMHPAIYRVVAAACIGGGLGLVFWLVFSLGSRSRFAVGNCGGGAWGCVIVAIAAGLIGLVVIIVLAWPLLHAAGVRPAWTVALIGPGVALILYRELVELVDRSFLSGLWILLTVSYAAAAVVSAPRLYRYWSAAVAVAVIASAIVTRIAVGY